MLGIVVELVVQVVLVGGVLLVLTVFAVLVLVIVGAVLFVVGR